jgi:hypothetical protein
MGARIIARIDVTPAARDVIQKLTEKLGMTRLSLHSRLVEWLSNQPPQILAVVMQPLPAKAKGNLVKLILKHCRQGMPKK